ncbi:hypothetical protein NQ317_018383 [Molorchus minor]|uniref:Thioredoxin-like fold domain-containing protein n=1 Tax=Molorchus minor TaxID=1323400 RepID=A0ABQ9JH46_9CUCU|nr:hypothetical protein NQ317_018383 [Molorchus minor]
MTISIRLYMKIIRRRPFGKIKSLKTIPSVKIPHFLETLCIYDIGKGRKLRFTQLFVSKPQIPSNLVHTVQTPTRLSRRYRIKSGVPTLVLLDREGATVSISAQEKLMEDPLGTCFPWRPRPVDQVLKDIVLQPGGAYFSEHKNCIKEDIRYGDLPAGVRGFYFSANWCPPCRAFTPQLAETYRIIKKKEPGFEIIFVSSDRSTQPSPNKNSFHTRIT